MPPDRREWPPGAVRVRWHPLYCDLKPRRLRARFRTKNLREIFNSGSASPKTMADESPKAQIWRQGRLFCQRVENNAFHLEDNHCVPDANEVFHACGVPVREANATVTCGSANGFGIVCAVNADARFV